MPEFKERPKVDKPKRKSTAIPARQTVRLVKEKYRRQIDQHPEGVETETTYASDQVEEVGRQVASEIKVHACQTLHKQRQNPRMARGRVTTPKKGTRGQEEKTRFQINSANAQKTGHSPNILRERPRTVFKSKSSTPGKNSGVSLKIKPSPKVTKVLEKTAQQHMKQQMVKKAKQAAQVAANVGRKAAVALTRAVASLVSSLVGLLGGGILLAILTLVVAVAAIASSPFGLFFAQERTAPGTVSVSEAVAQVNMAYNAKLEELQVGSYDSVELTGQAADWAEVLAVFAVRYAGAENGVDVATMDADRVDKLTVVFWDMTTITSWVETIDHDDSDADDDIVDSRTEYILHITVTAETAEDMKSTYSFTDYQISAVDELLADRLNLAALAGIPVFTP